ncbi:hypothetical protein HID58_091884, partial [Brassica napus]
SSKPANHVVAHLSGDSSPLWSSINQQSTLFVASDQEGKVPLYWWITADGYVAFADDVESIKSACGKSLASFPQGGLRSFENPKNKITAIPAKEEEIWGPPSR